MCGDQMPVDFFFEQRVDMFVANCFVGTIESGVAQATHARHQPDANNSAQAEDRLALSLSIGVNRIGLYLRPVLLEGIQNMDAFPHATGDEAGEQGDIGTSNMMVRDAAIAAVANVSGAQEIVLPELDVRAVGDRGLVATPVPRQRKADVLVD